MASAPYADAVISGIFDDLVITKGNGISVPEQIVRAVREGIHTRLLHAGEPLPSSRHAAAALGVSRGSVVAAYDQLIAEGLLTSRPRSGVAVSPDAPAAEPARPKRQHRPTSAQRNHASRPRTQRAAFGHPQHHPLQLELTPGRERHQPLDDPLWRRAWRDALNPPTQQRPHPSDIHPAGSPQLRDAVATHLRTVRAMDVPADSLIVTSGARDGLALTLRAVRHRLGRDPVVAVESPGFPGLRRTLVGSNVRVVSLGSDDDGPLPTSEPVDFALLTPNHQFPYGSPLPSARRGELLRWAADVGAYLVEDDYDSEYRHLGPPLPSLWSLDADRVIHLGTFTSVLGRDIGTGYVAAPADLVSDLVDARTELGMNVAPIMQRALAQYLDEGGLRRHIARGRRRLTAVHTALTQELTRPQYAPWHDTGHLLIRHTTPDVARTTQRRCREHGLGVGLLADGWTHAAHVHGLVLAYGACTPSDAVAGLRLVQSLLTSRP